MRALAFLSFLFLPLLSVQDLLGFHVLLHRWWLFVLRLIGIVLVLSLLFFLLLLILRLIGIRGLVGILRLILLF